MRDDVKKAKKEIDEKKKKKEKDLSKPRRATQAYICYTTEQIPLLREQNKGDGPKGFKVIDGVELKHTDFIRMAG